MTPDQAREIAIRVLRDAAEGGMLNYSGTDDMPRYAEAAAVLEAQANVEEKKAAFLEAARAEAAYRLSIFPPPMHPTKHLCERLRNFDLAYRALVESEREEAP